MKNTLAYKVSTVRGKAIAPCSHGPVTLEIGSVSVVGQEVVDGVSDQCGVFKRHRMSHIGQNDDSGEWKLIGEILAPR